MGHAQCPLAAVHRPLVRLVGVELVGEVTRQQPFLEVVKVTPVAKFDIDHCVQELKVYPINIAYTSNTLFFCKKTKIMVFRGQGGNLPL